MAKLLGLSLLSGTVTRNQKLIGSIPVGGTQIFSKYCMPASLSHMDFTEERLSQTIVL